MVSSPSGADVLRAGASMRCRVDVVRRVSFASTVTLAACELVSVTDVDEVESVSAAQPAMTKAANKATQGARIGTKQVPRHFILTARLVRFGVRRLRVFPCLLVMLPSGPP